MSTYDLVLTKTAVVSKGGDLFAYKRVSELGANTVPADTWHNGTYREKSKISFSQPDSPAYSESGALIQMLLEDMTFEIEVTSMQDDANVFNFLLNETEDNYFSIFIERGKIQSTKTQEGFFGVCRIEKSYSSDAPGRRPVIKISPLQILSGLTPTDIPTWAVGGSGNASAWVIPAKGYGLLLDQ